VSDAFSLFDSQGGPTRYIRSPGAPLSLLEARAAPTNVTDTGGADGEAPGGVSKRGGNIWEGTVIQGFLSGRSDSVKRPTFKEGNARSGN
jgi:hypothetical protein